MVSNPLGALVQGIREANGLSQSRIAKALGLSRTGYFYLEAGRSGFSDARLEAALDAVKATSLQKAKAWSLLFEGRGHSAEDAEAMALVKAGLKAAGAA